MPSHRLYRYRSSLLLPFVAFLVSVCVVLPVPAPSSACTSVLLRYFLRRLSAMGNVSHRRNELVSFRCGGGVTVGRHR